MEEIVKEEEKLRREWDERLGKEWKKGQEGWEEGKKDKWLKSLYGDERFRFFDHYLIKKNTCRVCLTCRLRTTAVQNVAPEEPPWHCV